MRRAAIALLVLAWADVAHAEGETDALPDPPSPVELRPATVRFRANIEGLRVHYLADPVLDDDPGGGVVVRLVSESRYPLLCESPCDRELPQGHFGLALGRGDRVVRFLEPLGVDGPTGVRLRWNDHSDLRLFGALTLFIGIPLGLAAAIVPVAVDASGSGFGDASVAGLVIGSTLVAASVVVGVLLVVSDDGASFSAAPLPADASGLFSNAWD